MNLTFACSAGNDLYRVAAGSGYRCARYETAAEAVERAAGKTAVLILADGYPETRTPIPREVFEKARGKSLRLYVEYPNAVPGIDLGPPQRTTWERAVVASSAFGESLPRLSILAVHDCSFLPASARDPLIAVARVAGFDTAVFGLPEMAFPLLFEVPEDNLIIATTKLSGFVTGRYAPYPAWKTIWEHILRGLDPASPVELRWTPTVRPAYGPREKLSADAERRAFSEGVRWYLNSRLLVHESDKAEIDGLLKSGAETRPAPGPDAGAGDGSLGILEGYAARIRHDGSQIQRVPMRADCNAEVAMAFALDWAVNANKRSRDIAGNLLDYVYFTSGMHGGARGKPRHPAYGLIAWGAICPAWEIANYGDDNARVMLGTIAAAACLASDKWDESLLRALLANLRTTGTLGFRGDRIDMPQIEANGWRVYHDAATVNHSPHFESYLWACNLWAYRHTGYKPFLEKTRTGIRMMMEAYPNKWRWQDSIESARMLLCLAWLVRVQDTPEHRAWIKTIAGDLAALQEPCGALRECISPTGGGGHYRVPASNEQYGTGETPLIQQNGDPASDQLYTTGFALLGLHEAAAATPIAIGVIKKVEDRLAEYLCRIQVRSREHPYLNGAWFRAFDFRRWEYWASSADWGWGAWSVESGWGPAWITSVLGMRLKGTSLWDMTAASRIASKFRAVQKQMAENDGGPYHP